MRQSPARHRHTYAEYLALDEASNTKHEFLDGEIFAMAGGTPEHAELSVAIAAALRAHLRGKCRVFSSDLRIRAIQTGLTTYPDVTVVCGPLERDPEDANTVINPTIIVEVLSDSTEEYDRGEKLAHYQRIPSLDAIILASQNERRLELWQRQTDGWRHIEAMVGGTLTLLSGEAELIVDELYEGVA